MRRDVSLNNQGLSLDSLYREALTGGVDAGNYHAFQVTQSDCGRYVYDVRSWVQRDAPKPSDGPRIRVFAVPTTSAPLSDRAHTLARQAHAHIKQIGGGAS